MTSLRRIAVLAALLALAAPAGAATVRSRLNQAQTAMNNNQLADALRLYTAIATDPTVPADDRLQSYGKVVDLNRRQKHYDAALAATMDMLALPMSDTRRQSLTLTAAELNYKVKNVPQAVKLLDAMAATYHDDHDTVATAELAAAMYLGRDKQYVPAAEHYDAALKALDPSDPRRAETIWNLSSSRLAADQYDLAIQAAKQLTDKAYHDSSHWINREAHERIINSLTKLNKPDDAIAQLRDWETSDPDAAYRQHWALRGAQIAQAAKKPDDAVAAYRRVIDAHCDSGSTAGWYEAQGAIVSRLAAGNDLPGALKAAHVLLDAAPDQNQATNAARLIVGLLQHVDKNSTRAKAFADFQLYGPAGRDGETGTADDVKDPMVAVGYPADAEREKAFTAAFPRAGQDASADAYRAWMCVYLGRPADAVPLFESATRRAASDDWSNDATALVMNGLRSAHGTGVGLEAAAKFLRYGPAGVDGKPGTGDDLPDPFPSAAPQPPWAAPPLSAGDRQAITHLQASLHDVIADTSALNDLRAAAATGYLQTVEALDVPQDPTPFAALLDRADRGMLDADLQVVLTLARGNQMHLGQLRAFIAEHPLGKALEKKIDVEFKRLTRPLDKLSGKSATIAKVPPIKG
jgi:tetratricopeptide (TPR) repeat protein